MTIPSYDQIQKIDDVFYLPFGQEKYLYYFEQGYVRYIYVERNNEIDVEECTMFTFDFTDIYYRNTPDQTLRLKIIHSNRIPRVSIKLFAYCLITFLSDQKISDIIFPSFYFVRKLEQCIYRLDPILQKKYFNCTFDDFNVWQKNSKFDESNLVPCIIYYGYFPEIQKQILNNAPLQTFFTEVCSEFFMLIITKWPSQIKQLLNFQSIPLSYENLLDFFVPSDTQIFPFSHAFHYLLTSSTSKITLVKHDFEFPNFANRVLPDVINLLRSNHKPQSEYAFPALFIVLKSDAILQYLKQHNFILEIKHKVYQDTIKLCSDWHHYQITKQLSQYIKDSAPKPDKKEQKEAKGKLETFAKNLSSLLDILKTHYLNNPNFSTLLDSIPNFNKGGYMQNLHHFYQILKTLKEDRIDTILNSKKGTYDPKLVIQYAKVLEDWIKFLNSYSKPKHFDLAAVIVFMQDYSTSYLDIPISGVLLILQSIFNSIRIPNPMFLSNNFIEDPYFKNYLQQFKPKKDEPDPVNYDTMTVTKPEKEPQASASTDYSTYSMPEQTYANPPDNASPNDDENKGCTIY